MTYQIKIFSRHLSKYSGIIKIFSFFDLIIRLFMFTYSARHARAFFLPIDRGLPPFDRGYTVIYFTFAAKMGGFFFALFTAVQISSN